MLEAHRGQVQRTPGEVAAQERVPTRGQVGWMAHDVGQTPGKGSQAGFREQRRDRVPVHGVGCLDSGR